jgi:hypothetical protein
MKKMLTLVSVLFFLSASAQVTQDDVNLVQAMYGKDKRDLMDAYMKFSDTAKANKFWRIYDKYEAERKKLGQQYFAIIQDYADNYEKLTDAKADQLVMRMSANNLGFENLYKKYYAQLKPAVGSLKASQFLQLENYLRSAVKINIMDHIPFIGEIDRTKLPTTKQ